MEASGDDVEARDATTSWSAGREVERLRAAAHAYLVAATGRGRVQLRAYARRRRSVHDVLVGRPASDIVRRDALEWADSALAPSAPRRRMAALAAVLAVVIFVLAWPLVTVIGAAIGFADLVLCYLVLLALTAPFAWFGERDKAFRVVGYARPSVASSYRAPADHHRGAPLVAGR